MRFRCSRASDVTSRAIAAVLGALPKSWPTRRAPSPSPSSRPKSGRPRPSHCNHRRTRRIAVVDGRVGQALVSAVPGRPPSGRYRLARSPSPQRPGRPYGGDHPAIYEARVSAETRRHCHSRTVVPASPASRRAVVSAETAAASPRSAVQLPLVGAGFGALRKCPFRIFAPGSEQSARSRSMSGRPGGGFHPSTSTALATVVSDH